MQYQLETSRQIITLTEPPMALGGEAYLYTIPENERMLAKIYHKPTPERAEKLEVMIAYPPIDPMANHGHASIAWPEDRLFTADDEHLFAGFVMPRVHGVRSLFEFYNPKTRREQCPSFHYRYLIRTARNLAAAFHALHIRNYVVGDVNESNIMVTETALVTLVDTDSFQVRKGDRVYRCPVGKPEFTPPELQMKNFRDIHRTVEHDNFGLAVLIFLLLMEGTHPFAGRFLGKGDPPPVADRITLGYYPYGIGLNIPFEPMPFAPPIGLLHPEVRTLMRRCFETGHTNPSARPSASEWLNALDTAEANLQRCKANPQHYYRLGFGACPWCERTRLLRGWDPFPVRKPTETRTNLMPPTALEVPAEEIEKAGEGTEGTAL